MLTPSEGKRKMVEDVCFAVSTRKMELNELCFDCASVALIVDASCYGDWNQ